MNDPMDVFDLGEDVVIEIVEMDGPVGVEGSFDGIDISEAPGIEPPRSAMELDGESDGVGTRSPAPKGNSAGPSVRP